MMTYKKLFKNEEY